VKKFPRELFFFGEVFIACLALREFPHASDILAMFLFMQLPIVSVIAIVWLDRTTGNNR